MHEDHERAVSPWAGFEFLTVHEQVAQLARADRPHGEGPKRRDYGQAVGSSPTLFTNGLVAQWIRASVSETEGWRFESSRDHK